jgi:hypothetical protein
MLSFCYSPCLVHLGIMLYRNYRAMGERGFDLRFVVRTLFFGVYTLIGMLCVPIMPQSHAHAHKFFSVTLTTVLVPDNSYSDIFAATCAYSSFATRHDVDRPSSRHRGLPRVWYTG